MCYKDMGSGSAVLGATLSERGAAVFWAGSSAGVDSSFDAEGVVPSGSLEVARVSTGVTPVDVSAFRFLGL